MRTENGYRFTLQFPGKTENQRHIGEYLEGLGSKKSRFIITAICEYLAKHPEELTIDSKTQVGIIGFSRDEIKDIIREILAERGALIQLPDDPPPAETSEANVDAMLEFLGAFS